MTTPTPAEPKYSDAEIHELALSWQRNADGYSVPTSNEDRGYSNALHDCASALLALLASRQATPDKAGVSEVTVCCGRRECGGECGNEWRGMERAPTREPSDEAALAHFTDYFVRNYPGPNTIIGNPNWHAPKIFRAAKYALTHFAQQSQTKVSGVDPDALYEQLTSFADPSCRDCDGRGVFYGNVCVCGCVMSKLQSQSAEAVRDGKRYREFCRQADHAAFPAILLNDAFAMGSGVLDRHFDAAMKEQSHDA